VIVASVLTPLEDVMRSVLEFFHNSIGLPWSWSIVATTVVVRILLVPLAVRQIHSMQRMQAHAPEMKEIQRKYKGDRQRMNEELMKFYKENNINPAASCLPLVAQIPVFIALFFVLKNFTKHIPNPETADLSWLGFVPDIADKASSHWSGYLLIAIYVLSQVASTYFMSTTMQQSQRILMMVLPIFFVTFIIQFPTGLVLYWMTTNLWTVGQGLITRRLVPKKPPAPPKRTSRTPPKAEPPPDDGKAVAAPKPAPSGPPRRVRRKKKRARR
jgi:YidC/Oxa1 family membrane protein insertase